MDRYLRRLQRGFMLPLLQQLVLSLAVLVRRADVRPSCPSVCLSRRSIFNLGRYYLDAGPLDLRLSNGIIRCGTFISFQSEYIASISYVHSHSSQYHVFLLASLLLHRTAASKA